MVKKRTKIFYCKTLQNLPKLGFLVWKQTIWQPWSWVSWANLGCFFSEFPCKTCDIVFVRREIPKLTSRVTKWFCREKSCPFRVKLTTQLNCAKSIQNNRATSVIFKQLTKVNNRIKWEIRPSDHPGSCH
jgi:hypothetical protein